MDETPESQYALARSAYLSAKKRGGDVRNDLRTLLLTAFKHHRVNDMIPALAQNDFKTFFAYLFGGLQVKVVRTHSFFRILPWLLFCAQFYSHFN